MNADDPRRTEMAEVAQLVPAPAERELPAGRQQALKEHLMSELRLAGSPPAGEASTRSRRKPVIVIAVAGAAALVATTLALLPGNTSGSSPAAARLLAKIATVAARQPGPRVRDSQFWYIKPGDGGRRPGVSGALGASTAVTLAYRARRQPSPGP